MYKLFEAVTPLNADSGFGRGVAMVQAEESLVSTSVEERVL